jgi:hypothetical protein
MKAPRYPQCLQSQTDHIWGKPEAQKTSVEPHLGQNIFPRSSVFDLAFSASLEAWGDPSFIFLGFLSGPSF